MTRRELAEKMEVAPEHVKRIIDGKCRITARTAYRLAEIFPNTSARFWMNLQANVNLWTRSTPHSGACTLGCPNIADHEEARSAWIRSGDENALQRALLDLLRQIEGVGR